MWLLPDNPQLLIIVGDLILLIAVLVRVRRQRAEAILRTRHLAWVARQEEADRRRDAEKARREQREREAVQQQAGAIADQISDGLARRAASATTAANCGVDGAGAA